jgi:hypothetical protein
MKPGDYYAALVLDKALEDPEIPGHVGYIPVFASKRAAKEYAKGKYLVMSFNAEKDK